MKISVANITFSKSPFLSNELLKLVQDVKFNNDANRLDFELLNNFTDNADCLIIGLEKFDRYLFEKNPNLKFLVKFGVGIDNIDLDLLKKYNIKFFHETGVNRFEVAEFAFSQILNLIRNVSLTGNLLRNGIWLKDGGFSLQEISVGIIGFGNIGSCLAEKLLKENCKNVFCFDLDEKKYKYVQGIKYVEIDELCINSDLISFHIPGDLNNHNFIDENLIQKMKKGVRLLNISRGSIMNMPDILKNIENNKIHSIAIDVYNEEPFFDSRIVNNNRIICTPHIAGNSSLSVSKMGMSVINNIKKILTNDFI